MSPDHTPLVILAGKTTRQWRILGPIPTYGARVPISKYSDRRYTEICVVHGDMDEALEVLARLESREP